MMDVDPSTPAPADAGLLDPSLARIASLPLPARAVAYNELHDRMAAELESTLGQERLP